VTRSAVTPTISTALLRPQDRIPRAPLGRWAGRLSRKLERCLRDERTAGGVSEQVGSIANNAALIAAHRGEGAVAWRLCERQLWWQHRLSRRARAAAIASRCVQPWVNLARLEALTGRCDAALARLQLLAGRRPGRWLALQPVRADGVGCQPIQHTDGDFEVMLENIYIIDSLKALLQNRRWAEAAEFATRMRREGPARLALWSDEAAVVAASRMGDHDGARAAVQAGLGRPEAVAWHRATFHLRRAEVEACAGNLNGARGELGRLVQVALRLSPAARSQLQPMYVLVRVAAACAEVGMAKEALQVAGAVYEGACTADDEVMRIEALRILAEWAPDEARAEWNEALGALERTTEYHRYRCPDVPPRHGAACESLYAALAEVLGGERP
jgi:hypothetical protein